MAPKGYVGVLMAARRVVAKVLHISRGIALCNTATPHRSSLSAVASAISAGICACALLVLLLLLLVLVLVLLALSLLPAPLLTEIKSTAGPGSMMSHRNVCARQHK